MNVELLNEIKRTFPNEYANDNNYQVAEHDLYVLFSIIDKHVFKSAFIKDNIVIRVFDIHSQVDHNWKGKFSINVEKGKPILQIYILKYDVDRFSHIVSVLCHEMIHLYDFKKAHLKQLYNKYQKIEVTRIGNKEFVYGYDAHGNYFKSFIPKFNKFGIIVSDTYNVKSKNLMKKIKESDDAQRRDEMIKFIFGENRLNEASYQVDNPDLKNRLENFANIIKNANAEVFYIDKDNWAVTME